ncbi:MAG: hypothetical protein KC777_17030 [Cyanobacteria bacterium HKST-UBA02]|nr:hypothetical protein [Cyanobacteria bacterium HKST-UBA02]
MFTPVSVHPPEHWQHDHTERKYQRLDEGDGSLLADSLATLAGSIDRLLGSLSRAYRRWRRTSRVILGRRLQDAQSHAMSRQEIEELLADPNPLVRMELAWNDSVPVRVLQILEKDDEPVVSEVARLRLRQMRAA